MDSVPRDDAQLQIAAPTEEQLGDPGFWRALCPELRVEDSPWPPPAVAVDEATLAAVSADIRDEGYFQVVEPQLPPDLVARLVRGVERLHDRAMPVTWLFVFDEAWEVFARLRPVAEAVLGEGYLWTPTVWTFRLGPGYAEAGWGPHRDGTRPFESVRADGRPKACTLWVPLTDATPANGCIYVVPRPLDTVEKIVVQNARAVPARAGSVLGWNHQVLHWGGRSSPKAAGSRVAITLELQRGDEEPNARPLLDPSVQPALGQRLGLVGLAFSKYRHFTHLPEPWASLATPLVKRYLFGGPGPS